MRTAPEIIRVISDYPRELRADCNGAVGYDIFVSKRNRS